LNALHISGNDLTLEAVREVALERRPVLLAPDARERVNAARAVVDTLVADNQVSYAITTGVGKLSEVRIAGDQIRELQINLVRSHAVGVGEPLSILETRAMMLLRANSLRRDFPACAPQPSTRSANCSRAASPHGCRRKVASVPPEISRLWPTSLCFWSEKASATMARAAGCQAPTR
jgi:hypothetical protein